MDLVSVVIPAHNSSSTVIRALRSCFNQSYSDIEIIVVDDCSEDSTAELVETIASEARKRVQLVRNRENMGSLEARRIGFSQARGDYVLFLDADDELDCACVEKAHDFAVQSGAEIVVFPIVPTYQEGRSPDIPLKMAREAMYGCPDCEFLGREIAHSIFRDNKIVWSVVGKLFKRELIASSFDSIPAQKMFQAEDAYAMFVIATKAKRLVGSSAIPAYKYFMGIGGTVVDQMIGASSYISICENIRAADVTKKYLIDAGIMDEFAEDYVSLRRALCNDPASRFPQTIIAEERLSAFKEYYDRWPLDEIVGSLAETHWQHPEDVCRSLSSFSIRQDSSIQTTKVIGIVYHSLGIGGIEAVIRHSSQLWESMGYKVVLFIDEGAEIVKLPKGVKLVYLPDCFRSQADQYRVRSARFLSELISNKVDVLVFHQWLGLTLPWDALLARCAGVATLVEVHGAFFCSFGYEQPDLLRLPLSYCIFDATIALSSSDAQCWWKLFCKHVFVTQNPTAPAFYKLRRKRHEKPTVVWCGRVDVDKGVDDVLIAAKELQRLVPSVVVKMFGPASPEMAAKIQKTIGVLGLGDCVELCGALSTEELCSEFEQADVFLLSSRMEGWCMSLAEAKAAGLPCVMYDMPYLTLCKQDTGVLTVPLGNAPLLGQQAARILLDDKLQLKLSEQAKCHAISLAGYDYEKFWKQVFSYTEGCRSLDSGNRLEGFEDSASWSSCFDMIELKMRESKSQFVSLADELSKCKSELDASYAMIDTLRWWRHPKRFLRYIISRALERLPRRNQG